jgi:hypothetical protein
VPDQQLQGAGLLDPGHVAAVYLGNMRSYAVRADGTFWCLGFGDYRVKGVLSKNLRVPTLLDLR